MNRAERRHHRERLANNRKHHWGRDISDNPKLIGMAVTTPCICSCWMCGNPRRKLKRITLKEKQMNAGVED